MRMEDSRLNNNRRRYRGDTKTFDELTFKEQAQAINMTAVQLRRQITAHLRRAEQEGRDLHRTHAVYTNLLECLLQAVRSKPEPMAGVSISSIEAAHNQPRKLIIPRVTTMQDRDRIGYCFRIPVEDAVEVLKSEEVVAISEIVAPEMVNEELWSQVGLSDGFRVFIAHYM
jgi:hypothetical protein